MTETGAWTLVAVVLAGGVAVDAATRVLARAHPPSYFGLTELIRGLDRAVSIRGFAARLGIPFACGAAAGLLAGVPAGMGAGILGALLVVWPPLMYDHLLPYAAQDRKTEVRVAYVLYAVSYAALGTAGAALATYAAAAIGLGPVGRWIAATEVPSSTELLAGVIGGLVGPLLLYATRKLTGRFRDPE